MPIIAVTAALWGCSVSAAPPARQGHQKANAATTAQTLVATTNQAAE